MTFGVALRYTCPLAIVNRHRKRRSDGSYSSFMKERAATPQEHPGYRVLTRNWLNKVSVVNDDK